MAGERILVIDDSLLIREWLKGSLGEDGYEVLAAADGAEGLSLALSAPPDLIIVDKVMPVMGGQEVCRQLKQMPSTQMIPVIMFTGSDSDMVEQLDSGADDYVSKAPDLRDLKAKVRVFLRIKRLQDQLVLQNQRLSAAQERTERELMMARNVQHGLLPRDAGRKGSLNVAFRYVPTEQVGGDLFGVAEEPGGQATLFISDVSGRGVSAALVTAMIKTCILAFSPTAVSVSDLVRQVNLTMSNLLAEDMFITAAFARISGDGRRMEYVNAGHLPILLVRGATRELVRLDSTCMPLGAFAEMDCESASVALAPGDRFFLYTDGIMEATDAGGQLFGSTRIEEAILSRAADPIESAVDGVLQDATTFLGGRLFEDDVNLLAAEIVPAHELSRRPRTAPGRLAPTAVSP